MMSGTKRVGRPSKNNNKVEVNNLIVELSKTNDYNAEICYMKVVDKDVKKKHETKYCFG